MYFKKKEFNKRLKKVRGNSKTGGDTAYCPMTSVQIYAYADMR